MAKPITYKNKTYPNMRSFCKQFGITYDALTSRLNEGVSVEEIVSSKGLKKGGYMVEGVFYASISQIARVYKVKDSYIRNLHAKGYPLEAIVTGAYKDYVSVKGKFYKNSTQAFEAHNVRIDYGQRYLEQGFSVGEIIDGVHKEFTIYLEEEDTYLHTIRDICEKFRVVPSWVRHQIEVEGHTYESIIEKRDTLFYNVYGDYFSTIPQIAKHYMQRPAEVQDLLHKGHDIEEALEILHKQCLALQELFQDRSICNLSDACQKHQLNYSSIRRYMRNGLSLMDAISTHKECFEIKESTAS